MFNLSGKTALITGATGGIGEAIAQTLHAQGATLALSGTRVEALQAVAAPLNAIAIAAQLSTHDGAAKLIAEAEAALGHIDILVCNAGITRDNLSMRMKDEEWDQVIAVNLTASFKLIRASLKGMMKRRAGRIINISSVVGTMGNPGQANYCASKAGLEGMTRSIALEIASRGITANCIAPGFIKTAMTDKLNEEQQSRITSNIPAARFGLPADVAAAVAYLSSDESAYITGQVLHVNGGLLMA